VPGIQRLSYAVLRPATTPPEDDRIRVLTILDSAAEAMVTELRVRAVAAEVRVAVGSRDRVRLGLEQPPPKLGPVTHAPNASVLKGPARAQDDRHRRGRAPRPPLLGSP
jgi:hypothetical protein